jgi:hypothetical protein
MVKKTQRFYMNLFVKLPNFNFVFGLSLDCFHRSRLSKEVKMKKMKIGQVFGHLAHSTLWKDLSLVNFWPKL